MMQHSETTSSAIIKAVFEHLKEHCTDYNEEIKRGFLQFIYQVFQVLSGSRKLCIQVKFSCTRVVLILYSIAHSHAHRLS